MSVPFLASSAIPVKKQQENKVILESLVSEYGTEFGLSDTAKYQLLMTCIKESGLDFDAHNGQDHHKGSVGSFGICQFGIPTYNEFALKLGESTRIDPWNVASSSKAQVRVAAYMFSLGKQRRWTEWRKQFGDLRK